MGHNPYGESCGSSLVTPPRQVRVSLGKMGTPSQRLSDTNSGKAPKRPKTRGEVEEMEQAKPRFTVIHPPAQPPCHCAVCKARTAEQDDLIDDLESGADDLLAIVKARVARNNQDDTEAQARAKVERERHIREIGDMDS